MFKGFSEITIRRVFNGYIVRATGSPQADESENCFVFNSPARMIECVKDWEAGRDPRDARTEPAAAGPLTHFCRRSGSSFRTLCGIDYAAIDGRGDNWLYFGQEFKPGLMPPVCPKCQAEVDRHANDRP